MSAASRMFLGYRARNASQLEELSFNVRLFRRDRLAVIALGVILAWVLAAIAAPILAPYPAEGRGDSHIVMRLKPPSAEHRFGTDNQGRDVLSRLIYGSRISLMASFWVTAFAVLIGAPLGALAGYYGGWLDDLIMRITDLVLAFPALLLSITIVAMLGPGLTKALIAITLSWWPWYTRLVRGMAVSLRERPFVEAARSMGVRDVVIVFRHILPNAMTPVIVQATLDVGTVILAAASLSFLGLGAQQPQPDWGLMVADGRVFVLEQWWFATFPGLAIFGLVLSFNLVGDALRDVLDPRQKR